MLGAIWDNGKENGNYYIIIEFCEVCPSLAVGWDV